MDRYSHNLSQYTSPFVLLICVAVGSWEDSVLLPVGKLVSWVIHSSTLTIYGFIIQGLPLFPFQVCLIHLTDLVLSNYRIYFFEDLPSTGFSQPSSSESVGSRIGIRINEKKTMVVDSLKGYNSQISSRHFYILGSGLN